MYLPAALMSSRRLLPPIYYRDFAYTDSRATVLTIEPDPEETDVRLMRSSRFADLLTGPMLDFYVGPERKHWSLHRTLLCHHSETFACDAVTALELPGHDPRGFALLVKWLYQYRLDDISSMSEDEKYEHAVSCHKLYMLCDKFDMISVKNKAINVYRRCLREAQLVPDASEIYEIYSTSPTTSPFRRLMVQIAARQIMDPEMEREIDSYKECIERHPEFVIALLKEIRRLTGGVLFEDPTAGNDCQYHDHSDGSNCQMAGKGRRRRWTKPPVAKPESPPLRTVTVVDDAGDSTASQDNTHSATPSTGRSEIDVESSSSSSPEPPSAKPQEQADDSLAPRPEKSYRPQPGELKTMTPSVTPARDRQAPGVSSVVHKFNQLHTSHESRPRPPKLRAVAANS